MERRKLTKEDIDKVRSIEGFPIGTDEDIIALSDAPFYTACPNPFIEEFIRENGTPYEEDTDDYHREPFAADVSAGKTDPVYMAHTYHTKVPHKAIMQYILHYTEPGDVVLDGFCGTGMTGVAAQACGTPDQELEAKLKAAKIEFNWGIRKAILNDLSPAATFIAANYNAAIDPQKFDATIERILNEVEKETAWMYYTRHTAGQSMLFEGKGVINYTIWSDVFICPHCGKEFTYWDVAVDENSNMRKEMHCPHCIDNVEIIDEYVIQYDDQFHKDVNYIDIYYCEKELDVRKIADNKYALGLSALESLFRGNLDLIENLGDQNAYKR